MSQKRVVRVISYEGIDSWVDMMLRSGQMPLNGVRGKLPRTFFAKGGTMCELARIELDEGEMLTGLDALGKIPSPS